MNNEEIWSTIEMALESNEVIIIVFKQDPIDAGGTLIIGGNVSKELAIKRLMDVLKNLLTEESLANETTH